jgi:hypothetical protein
MQEVEMVSIAVKEDFLTSKEYGLPASSDF